MTSSTGLPLIIDARRLLWLAPITMRSLLFCTASIVMLVAVAPEAVLISHAMPDSFR